MVESAIKYSIIVPVYNGEEYITDCINSLLKIDYDNDSYEIIIINDGSTDKTEEIIKSFTVRYSNIKYAFQPNQGQGEARNLGLELATGEWILFVDSDDWINSSNVLTAFDSLISEYASIEIDMIKSISLISETQRLNLYLDNKCKIIDHISGSDLLCNFSFAAHVYLGCYNRSFLNKVNYRFRKTRGYEDTDWTFIINLKASNILLIDFPFYSYYYNKQSTTVNPKIPAFLGFVDSWNTMMKITNTVQMSQNIRNKTQRWIKNKITKPTSGILKYSKDFKIKDSVKIINNLNFSLIDSEIRPHCSAKDRLILYLLRDNPLFLVTIIKTFAFAKRKVLALSSSVKKIIRNLVRTLHRVWLTIRSHHLKSFSPDESVLIIAPHPDDEVLGCGGFISRMVEADQPPHIIILSGGEASHNGCCNISHAKVKSARRDVSREALSILGVPESHVHRLNFPDGQIDLKCADCTELKDLIFKLHPSTILLPHWGEGWSDHIKTAHIIKKIAPQNTDFWYYCVWMWIYNVWRGLDWKNAAAIHFSSEEQYLKRRAISAYLSPVAPCGRPWSGLLPSLLIKAHRGKVELYFKDKS